MKRTFAIRMAAALGALAIALSGCQKAPELTLSGPATVELSADGSAGSITFTANRDWMVAANDSWVHVSPASGAASDTPVTVSVSCDPNTTYEDRSSTVVIKAEGLSQSVTVKQPANLGLIVPQGDAGINLPAGAQTFEVEVQANVSYTVSISADWVKQTGTKALTSKTLIFSAEENTTYEERSATVSITGSGLNRTVSVKQAARAGLEIAKTDYEVAAEGGTLEVAAKTNLTLELTPSADWIHHTATKALSDKTLVLSVDENKEYQPREGQVTASGGGLSVVLTVRQAAAEPPYLKVTELHQTDEGFAAAWETNVKNTEFFAWMLYRFTDEAEDGVMNVAYGRMPLASRSLNAVAGTHRQGETWLEPLKPGDTYYFSIVAMQSSGSAYVTLAQNNSLDNFFVAAGSAVPAGAVDLGLSVYWAKENIGYNQYFAWGETETKGEYSILTYKHFHVTSTEVGINGYYTKYNPDDQFGPTDGKTVLEPGDDAAHVILGGKWRMPTKEEVEELVSCRSVWGTSVMPDGAVISSVFITGPNGNEIIIPALGMKEDEEATDFDKTVCFWTSTVDYQEKSVFAWAAYGMKGSSVEPRQILRQYGLPIRPVCDKE